MVVIVVASAGCPLPINLYPQSDAGPDITATVGQRVQLDGSGSADPDKDSLTYSWTRSYGNSVQISDPNEMMATFVPPAEGTYEFTLTASDGRGGNDADLVRVNCGTGDRPPVAIASASSNPAEAGHHCG
jgi:hypothetical protein